MLVTTEPNSFYQKYYRIKYMKYAIGSGPIVGVLGGMGPLAGAYFMQRLVLLNNAIIDQSHVPAILINDPRVPPRQSTNYEGENDPYPWMLSGLKKLELCNAQFIVMPCNTAHHWYDQLAAQTQLPWCHIAQAVIMQLQQQGIVKGDKVGLLATQTTLNLQFYQQALEQAGYQIQLLTPWQVQQFCTVAIDQVKSNHIEQAQKTLQPALNILQNQVDALVLACTELPLAFAPVDRLQYGVPVIDSVDALALAAIHWHQQQT